MTDSIRTASGWGLATTHPRAGVLDTWFPAPVLGPDPGPAPGFLASARRHDPAREVEVGLVHTSVDLDAPPADVSDAYLRLHLLSHRLALPRTIILDGLFQVLPNVVWTTRGPCAVDGLDRLRARLLGVGETLTVLGVDKFPRMVDYVIPEGVRIADADRVRLGAHLAPGTTVMHEGFVNFNAGTLGASMVEGRISAGVLVGDGSDIGGGASIMGTLSGGGKEMVTIGRGCLLGAESGVGISLGDNCVVEAGLYLTAGVKVTMPDGSTPPARELSGQSDWLFLRDSLSGRVRALPRAGRKLLLNDALHAN